MTRLNMDLIAKRKITPHQWLDLVLKAPKTCRTEVAHIIWWDWFSGRETSKRWDTLDSFLKNPTWSKPSDEIIIKALVNCGYSHAHATNRIGNKGNTVKANKA